MVILRFIGDICTSMACRKRPFSVSKTINFTSSQGLNDFFVLFLHELMTLFKEEKDLSRNRTSLIVKWAFLWLMDSCTLHLHVYLGQAIVCNTQCQGCVLLLFRDSFARWRHHVCFPNDWNFQLHPADISRALPIKNWVEEPQITSLLIV